jgi:hypothetical protein
MAVTVTVDPSGSRAESAWRRSVLRAAGLDDPLARAVAASDGHDLHRLLGLLERGCPLPTALRISSRREPGRGG